MRVVAHHLRLAELGERERRGAHELRGDERIGLLAATHVASGATGALQLEEERLERGHLGHSTGLEPDTAHDAATGWRAVMRSTAPTSASMSASVVSSVHWIVTPSPQPV